FTGAEMRAGMKNQKRQLELIGADEFLRKGADRVRQKLRIRCREVNQIIRVGKDRQQLATLAMSEKRADLLTRKWTREPLHVVFHEYLDCSALDRTAALDRSVHAPGDRHVRAEKNSFMFHVERI